VCRINEMKEKTFVGFAFVCLLLASVFALVA